MEWTAHHVTGRQGVTVSLQVHFLKLVFVEQEIEVLCRIARTDGDKVHLTAEIKSARGDVCTRGTGTYVLMDRARFRDVVGDESELSFPEFP